MSEKCDICGMKAQAGLVDTLLVYDEDGRNWCVKCISTWEKEHQQHWEDGTPLTNE